MVTAVYDDLEPAHTAGYVWPPTLALLPPPPARVLEIGCGNGAFARVLLQRGYDVVAFDISESGVTMARKGHPPVEALVLSVAERPPDAWSAAFDAAVSLEVIEHLYEPALLARRAHWALKRGGCCVFSTPYHGYLKHLAIAVLGGAPRHFDPLADGGHIKFFSPPSLGHLLRAAGFCDLSFRFAGRLPLLWKSMIVSARKGELR